MTGLSGASGALGSLPAITWLELSTEDLGRWARLSRLSWPRPLASSGVGRWQLPLDELTGKSVAETPHRTRGEERLLEMLAYVLTSPSYCAYVIRNVGELPADSDDDSVPSPGGAEASEAYYTALARDDEAIVIVDEPGTVRLGRTHPTTIAAAITGQLPTLRAAPVTRVSLAAQTVELIAAGFERGDTPERTLRSAMASAGIPEQTAARIFAIANGTLARGIVGAVGYTADGARDSARCASWTELSDGGMISTQSRGTDVVWEPLTPAAIGRTIADSLAGLGS